MGSGKSTLGKALAETLGYGYVDTDTWIEQKEGKRISEIFEDSGEEYFRELEQKALCACIQKEKMVIATGGGLPCFFDNMDVLYLINLLNEHPKHLKSSANLFL